MPFTIAHSDITCGGHKQFIASCMKTPRIRELPPLPTPRQLPANLQRPRREGYHPAYPLRYVIFNSTNSEIVKINFIIFFQRHSVHKINLSTSTSGWKTVRRRFQPPINCIAILEEIQLSLSFIPFSGSTYKLDINRICAPCRQQTFKWEDIV